MVSPASNAEFEVNQLGEDPESLMNVKAELQALRLAVQEQQVRLPTPLPPSLWLCACLLLSYGPETIASCSNLLKYVLRGREYSLGSDLEFIFFQRLKKTLN